MSLLVTDDTHVNSVKQLVDLAKKKPGALNYGSPGNGTLHHVTTELFKHETGINMTHIPYKGTAGAINDIVGGRINVMFMPISVALPLIKGAAKGKVKMIAVLAPERSPLLPDVPTMKEAGYPEVHTEFWYGFFAPTGTPPDIVSKVNADINALLQSSSVKDVLIKQGMNPIGGSPAKLGEHVKSEISRWIRVVNAAKIRAD
jgi:tripartite-type tricarboxylate transporter receptor subunit TctC